MSRVVRSIYLMFAIIVSGSMVFSGCLGTSERTVNLDDQYGHRIEGETPDGRQTIIILPAEEERTYRFFPAVYQSVNVRPAPIRSATDEGGVSVEILVKGAFPDACTELHDVEQVRTGNLIRVSLQMRRPAGAICASVLRPYRFYLELEGLYAVGAYSLFLNDRAHPFEIRAASGNIP